MNPIKFLVILLCFSYAVNAQTIKSRQVPPPNEYLICPDTTCWGKVDSQSTINAGDNISTYNFGKPIFDTCDKWWVVPLIVDEFFYVPNTMKVNIDPSCFKTQTTITIEAH